jgi:hypothetical protein
MFTKFLQCIEYIILKSTASAALLYPPSFRIPGWASTVIILHLLTYVYIVWATANTPHPRQNLFYLPVLQFCRRKNIKDNKKNMAFLLVWDRELFREIPFLAYYVFQLELVHLYQTSSLLPSPLPIMASASLRLLYLLLYSGHINHIQVLYFLPLPYSPCVQPPLSMTHVQ